MQPGEMAVEPDHRPKEVLGLAMLWFYGLLGWSSLLALIANAGIARIPWRDAILFIIAGLAGGHTIRKSGLLALASRVRRDARPTGPTAWWCWLAHFKLSGAVLVGSGVAIWLAFSPLLMWLVEPEVQAWSIAFGVPPPLLYFGAHGILKAKLLLAVGFAGLAMVPALASDTWQLLTPLMSARAARLRFVFALATGVVIVATVLLLRDSDAWMLFVWFGPQDVKLLP